MRANHVPRSPSGREIESEMNTKSISLLNGFCRRKPHQFARGAKLSLTRPPDAVQEFVRHLYQTHHLKFSAIIISELLAKAANSGDPEQTD